jgi:hypothetical protein
MKHRSFLRQGPIRTSARRASGRPTVRRIRRNLIALGATFSCPRGGMRRQPRRSAGYARPSRRSRRTCEQSSGRTGTAAGWRASTAASKTKTASGKKIAEKLRFQPDREATEIVREIPDTIRYTFCLRPEIYTAGYYDIMRRLEDCGYEMFYSKNWWTNPEYKGINTRWVTPEGQRFEVQFHTPSIIDWEHGSYDEELVEVSHEQAEKIIRYFRDRWGPSSQPPDS